MFRLAVTAGWGALAAAVTLSAQGAGSLSVPEIESTDTQSMLQIVREENRALRSDLGNARETVRELTEALAVARSEAETFRREAGQLRLQLEALGVESADPDGALLRQRLLRAVRDLEAAVRERDQAATRLAALAEAVVRFLPSADTGDAQARVDLETELRAANALLAAAPSNAPEPQAIESSLTEAMVVSFKEDLSLVVANVGSRQGVRLGMPFEVWRGETRIGSVRVVDVREGLCGAVIQELGSDKERIRVGDRLRVMTR